jgi:hypothetical protein
MLLSVFAGVPGGMKLSSEYLRYEIVHAIEDVGISHSLIYNLLD